MAAGPANAADRVCRERRHRRRNCHIRGTPQVVDLGTPPASCVAGAPNGGRPARREAGMKRQIQPEPSPTRECRKPMPERSLLKAVAISVAILLVIPSGGCSWIGVTSPPQRPVDAAPPVQCTRSTSAPVGDTIIGVLAVLGGVGTVAYGSSGGICMNGMWGGPPAPCPVIQGAVWGGAGIIVAGVAALVSAGFGYSWTAECRELEELQTACLAGVEDSCTALRQKPPSSQRQEGPPSGFEAGKPCAADAECRPGLICRYGYCATAQGP